MHNEAPRSLDRQGAGFFALSSLSAAPPRLGSAESARNLLFAFRSLCQHWRMPADSPLSLTELRALEGQVQREPAAANGTLPFLKDGMLAVIRTTIEAMEALEQER